MRPPRAGRMGVLVKRVLFVSEAVTLAQVVRLLTLARALDPNLFEVHFASAVLSGAAFSGAPALKLHRIHSLSPADVERSLAWGGRIYGQSTLRDYVREELKLLAEVRPDLVVGDLRWSLGVSARAERVPYAALVNAYWSPYAVRDGFPVPDHPMVRLLGERLATAHFPKALPWVFRHFAAPLNAVRREYGLPAVEGLLELLVDADFVLYADPPSLVPTRALPSTHRFLGPVLWSPQVPLPGWWDAVPPGPCVYVTLGSSGYVRALPRVVAAIGRLPVNLLVATAGRARLADVPKNVFIADYLPGDLAARRSRLVITNGGSSTGYQALAEGRPVIGLPWNFDQYLASEALRRFGAGEYERSTLARADVLEALVRRALDGELDAGARRAQAAVSGENAAEAFRGLIHERLLSPVETRRALSSP